ncbi:MAG: 30S ribosomal protein S2 [Patescibacteria group bacterium]
MAVLPEMVEMLKCGVHFGHRTSKRHPKMANFIFGAKDGISILDLDKTIVYLKEALEYLEGVARSGGTILFVGAKNQAAEIVKEQALRCGMPYVHTRWLGGTLTNFAVISKMIKKYKKLKSEFEKGEVAKFTKKEQLDLSRDMEELEGLIGGIAELTKLPDVVYIVDVKKDKTASTEAQKKKIPIVALCDSNINPECIAYPIPANDDAIKSIRMMTTLVSDAILEGKDKRQVDIEKAIAQKAADAKTAEAPAAKPAAPAQEA